jgi:Zn-dependent protease with chaperone function
MIRRILRRLGLLLLILAVPAVAFAVAFVLVGQFEGAFQEALVRDQPQMPAEERKRLSISGLCADPAGLAALGEETCDLYALLTLMGLAALVTGLGGLGWLGLIALLGRLSRGRPTLIMRLFRPGVRITNLFVIGLMLLHGALAVAAVYVGEAALFGVIHPWLLVVIGAGAVFGAINVARATFGIVKAVAPTVIGRSLSRPEAPALWNFVAQACEAIGVQPPDDIVVGLEPNFFVTEMPVRSLGGEHTGRTLYLSLPFLAILNRDELRSVLGHELTHFHGEDTALSRRFYPVYRGTVDALEALYHSASGITGTIALLPAWGILSYFLRAFSVSVGAHGRARELAADEGGAKLAGGVPTATALVKIHAFAPRWEDLHGDLGLLVVKGESLRNLSAAFLQRVADRPPTELLANLETTHLGHPTDTHPPLADRLAHLGFSLERLGTAALEIRPDDLLRSLVPGSVALEEELSAAEHAALARALGVEPAA